MTTITTHPLATLRRAPENARHGVTYDLDALAALASSILEMHRQTGRGVIEPLKAYAEGDGFAVWDGGRRLAALNLIADEGDGAAVRAAVPVIITTQEEARIASAATFVREDMAPADKFLLWNGLFDGGQTPQQIAAAVGASERDVAQLLRFRQLAPEIFAAFQAGRFDFDAALAFTLSDDHERQRAVLDSFGDKAMPAHYVRQRMREGAVTATDRRARWVGRKAYAAAGGVFLTDLFSNREVDEAWADAALLDRLFKEKLAETVKSLEAEGWGVVDVLDGGYGWARGLVRMTPEGTAKKGKPKPFTADQMAAGGAYIVLDYSDVKIERGWQKEKKAKADAGAAALPLAKQNPARYGWGHKGHHVMTQVATEATRVALMRKPDVALDALATQLAWSVLRRPQYGGVSDQLASRFVPEHRHGSSPIVAVEGMDEFEAAIAAWKARLPTAQVAFCDAVRALSADEKQTLLALCFAATLDADEDKFDGYTAKPQRWRHLGWMAREAGVDVVQAWTPDQDFLKGGSKEALTSAAVAMDGNDECVKGAKKSQMAEYVAAWVQANKWRPEVLATFTDVADPDPAEAGLVGEDEDRDASDEAEYQGWIAAAFIDDHGRDADEAAQLAAAALAEERGRADGAEVGHPDYSWTRADARSSAQDYLAILAEDAQDEG